MKGIEVTLAMQAYMLVCREYKQKYMPLNFEAVSKALRVRPFFVELFSF
jgi:hypothetical protein